MNIFISQFLKDYSPLRAKSFVGLNSDVSIASTLGLCRASRGQGHGLEAPQEPEKGLGHVTKVTLQNILFKYMLIYFVLT